MMRFLLMLGACAAFAAAQVPSNDACSGATPLVVGVNAGTTVGATPTSVSFSVGCAPFAGAAADVWFVYTPAGDESVTLALSGPGADRIAVYVGTCSDPGGAALCEGGPGGVFPIGMAESALVRVGTAMPGGGPFNLTVTVSPLLQTFAPAATPAPVTAPSPAHLMRPRVEILGVGCGGSGSVEPSLDATLPMLGHPLLLQIEGGEPLAPAMILADMGRTSPFHIPFLPSGCISYLDPIRAMPVASLMLDALGAGSQTGVLPSDPALAGLSITLQAVIVPPDGTPFLQLTNGLRLRLGR